MHLSWAGFFRYRSIISWLFINWYDFLLWGHQSRGRTLERLLCFRHFRNLSFDLMVRATWRDSWHRYTTFIIIGRRWDWLALYLILYRHGDKSLLMIPGSFLGEFTALNLHRLPTRDVHRSLTVHLAFLKKLTDVESYALVLTFQNLVEIHKTIRAFHCAISPYDWVIWYFFTVSFPEQSVIILRVRYFSCSQICFSIRWHCRGCRFQSHLLTLLKW